MQRNKSEKIVNRLIDREKEREREKEKGRMNESKITRHFVNLDLLPFILTSLSCSSTNLLLSLLL